MSGENDYWIKRYKEKLAEFSRPGSGFAALGATANSPSLGFLARAAGLSAEEVVEDAHALGRRDHDGDIRRSWETATTADAVRGGDAFEARGPRRMPAKARPDTRKPDFVPRMVRAGGGEAGFDTLRDLSPYWFPRTANPQQAQTAPFIRLYHPNDVLHIATDKDQGPTTAQPGHNLRTAAQWSDFIDRGETIPGSLIKPNTLTGRLGLTGEGKSSYGAKSCLASFPFLVVEFDNMPLPVQCAFWRGLLVSSKLGAKVAALVYSGSKSLHGFMRLGCATLDDWEAKKSVFMDLLCSAHDPAFRADEQAMRPGQAARLPGITRMKTGKMQELLYLSTDAIPAEVRAANAAAWARAICVMPEPSSPIDEEDLESYLAAIDEATRYTPEYIC